MNRIQISIGVVGIAVMALMVLFPPWKTVYNSKGRYVEHPIGYSFIASPPENDYAGAWGEQIDMTRLLIQCFAVTGITVVLVLVCRIAKIGYEPTKKP